MISTLCAQFGNLASAIAKIFSQFMLVHWVEKPFYTDNITQSVRAEFCRTLPSILLSFFWLGELTAKKLDASKWKNEASVMRSFQGQFDRSTRQPYDKNLPRFYMIYSCIEQFIRANWACKVCAQNNYELKQFKLKCEQSGAS